MRNRFALCAAVAMCLSMNVALRADALDDDLAAAKALLVAGKDDEAAIRLDALEARARVTASSNPTDAHVQYILGMAAMYAGHDAPALSALDMALRLDPKNAQYAMSRAQLALYQDKPKDAVTLLTKLVALDDKNLDAWEMLGESQLAAGLPAEAQQSYQKAADLAPRQAKYVAEVAQTLVSQHKEDEALAAYQKALDVDSKYAMALANIGQIYQTRKDYDKALAAYAQMVAIDPTDFRAIAKQVQLYEATGKLKERDAARDQIFALKKTGKIDADSFCREQFDQGKSNVIVLEYFELKGPMAVRYAFNVLAADGKSVEKRVSLGSYMETTALARETGQIKADERMFHLDVYIPDGHQTLGMFTKEPTYEETRDMVKKYFDGTLKPGSMLTVTTRPAATRGGTAP